VQFQSILFDRSDAGRRLDEGAARELLADLRLDHVIDSTTDDLDEYHLRPLFLTPLSSVDSTNYRQDVFRDLEDPALVAHIRAFSKTLRSMREHLAHGELHSRYQKLRWFTGAVGIYCEAVTGLTNGGPGGPRRSHRRRGPLLPGLLGRKRRRAGIERQRSRMRWWVRPQAPLGALGSGRQRGDYLTRHTARRRLPASA